MRTRPASCAPRGRRTALQPRTRRPCCLHAVHRGLARVVPVSQPCMAASRAICVCRIALTAAQCCARCFAPRGRVHARLGPAHACSSAPTLSAQAHAAWALASCHSRRHQPGRAVCCAAAARALPCIADAVRRRCLQAWSRRRQLARRPRRRAGRPARSCSRTAGRLRTGWRARGWSCRRTRCSAATRCTCHAAPNVSSRCGPCPHVLSACAVPPLPRKITACVALTPCPSLSL